MPLAKDTLQLIIDQAVAANGIAATHTPVAVLPEGVTVKSLEQFQLNRSRFRGALKTSSLRDFADYTIGREGPAAKGFVDPDAMRCVVFFNLGDETTPGHADDTAALTLKPTAAFTALQQIAGKKLDQQELAEWIEDWLVNLKATQEGGKAMDLALAIHSVRNITIKAKADTNHSVHNFGASRTAMEEIEAASADARLDSLHFRFVPYEGLGERVFTLKLSILTSGDKPTLKLRWVGQEQQVEEIAQEFKSVLAQEVGGAASLTLGTFSA